MSIFWELFWTFFKIGALTFGGGYAMLGIVQSEVIRLGWLDGTQLADYVAISESTPGPLAINIATAIGSEKGGEVLGVWGSLLGALLATLGTVLPSFIIILIVARFFESFKDSRIMKGFMVGLKPAVVGLIGSAFITLGEAVIFPSGTPSLAVFQGFDLYVSLVIFVGALILAFKKLHPIAIIGISAACGIAAGFLLPQ